METVLVRGVEEAEPLVKVVTMALSNLFANSPLAAYDLVMMARDRDYSPFGNNGITLMDLNLVGEDNQMHASIRNIVLACTSGDGLEMRFNPALLKESSDGPPTP